MGGSRGGPGGGPSTLRRLLQVLEIEEDQARMALESAVADCRLLEQRLIAALDRSRNGRRLVLASAQSGDLTDRWAGMEETRLAAGHAGQLKPRIKDAETVVSNRRQAYLAKRVERRQAETLIEEARAREAVEAARRSQQALDDWYLNRLGRNRREQERRGKDGGQKCGQERGQGHGDDSTDGQSLKDANAGT